MIAARIIAAIPNPRDVLVSHSSLLLLVADLGVPLSDLAHARLGWGLPAYRSSLTESMPREQCSSSPHTPRVTTWEENGLQEP